MTPPPDATRPLDTLQDERSVSVTTPRPEDTQAPKTNIMLVFIGLMLAMFMFSLNQTVLATALPTIVGELDGVDQMLWVSTAFMLASTCMMPIYGKIGDLFGRKPLFITAISLFLVGSLIALLAHSMAMLILGRVFQGIGGGGMMILSQAIIAAIVPARERGKYMGAMGSVFAVSSVAGPLIGGWMTEGPGWRWNFAINFPLGLIAIFAAVFFLKLPKVPPHARPKVDVAGMVLIAIFTTCVVLGSAWGGNKYDWDSTEIIGLFAVALVAAIVFVPVELKVSEPIIPMSLFKDRNFVLATIAGVTIGVSMFGVLGYMPTFLQMSEGVDATKAGLMMVPMMATMLVSSTGIGFVVAKTGKYKVYPLAGMVIVAAALFLTSQLPAGAEVWKLLSLLAMLGLGLGLSMQLLVLIVQNSFPVEMVGTATASNNFFRQIGATLGMSVIGSLFTSRLLENLTEVMQKAGAGAAGAMGGSTQLTPEIVKNLPGPLHDMVVGAYHDALIPLFVFVAPIPLVGFLFAVFIKQVPLATKIRHNGDEGAREVVDTGAMAVVGAESAAFPEIAEAEVTEAILSGTTSADEGRVGSGPAVDAKEFSHDGADDTHRTTKTASGRAPKH